MNKLYALKNFGFKISWNLIAIGLFGKDEIPTLITKIDILEYLYDSLTNINEQTKDIVTLICEQDNSEKFNSFIKRLAQKDSADIVVQKRKWRAYLLKDLIDNINDDSLQGMLELMEFWISMGLPTDCPQKIPSSDNQNSLQDYFSQASYEFNLDKNQKWLKEEILRIIELED